MKNVSFLLNLMWVLIASAVLIGCGTRTGNGAVSVELTNATTSSLVAEMKSLGALGVSQNIGLQSDFLGVTPTIYQMKMVAMYVVEDVDPVTQDNMGAATRIWTSNKCDADLTLCGIGPAAGAHIVDYFDFAVGTEAVNAILNSFRRDSREAQVNLGTYRYIRIDFTGATGGQIDTTVANLKYGTSSANEVRAQKQAYTIELPEPLVLAEGESFTVNLAYSLENRFYSSANASPPPAEAADHYWTCNGSGAGVPCIIETEFVPTVTKN